MKNSSVALVLVSHENAATVARMTQAWKDLTSPAQCVVAYGGDRSDYEKIAGEKVWIDDPRLRTRDHQREFQSYSKLLAAALAALADKSWDWLFFAEYDLIPLSSDLFSEIISTAESEDADLLGVGLCRLDNTLHPHYGAHAASAGWSEWLKNLSVRDQSQTTLSCLGSMQFWRREAIEAVVAVGEPIPSYLEILLPTVAHHLGFRVRNWKSQLPFVKPDPLAHQDLAHFKKEGAFVVHPIKAHW